MIWSKIKGAIDGIFVNKRVCDETLQELEDALISADVGVGSSAKIITLIRERKFPPDVIASEIKDAIAKIIESMLLKHEKDLPDEKPLIILFAGVNGGGKTTVIAKIANIYKAHGVRMVAADTFRAAAKEQLSIWAEKIGCSITCGINNADPASVAFAGIREAEEYGEKVILIDTSGRLPNNTSLMNELLKIKDVITKKYTSFERILVLDATIGTHSVTQAEIFNKFFSPTGVIMTKLDGTAKGGVLINVASTINTPIYFTTHGEGENDIRKFRAKEFASDLVL